MEEKKRNIDRRLEQKIGFDQIRRIISDRCSTAYAVERTATETFSTNQAHIRKTVPLQVKRPRSFALSCRSRTP